VCLKAEPWNPGVNCSVARTGGSGRGPRDQHRGDGRGVRPAGDPAEAGGDAAAQAAAPGGHPRSDVEARAARRQALRRAQADGGAPVRSAEVPPAPLRAHGAPSTGRPTLSAWLAAAFLNTGVAVGRSRPAPALVTQTRSSGAAVSIWDFARRSPSMTFSSSRLRETKDREGMTPWIQAARMSDWWVGFTGNLAANCSERERSRSWATRSTPRRRPGGTSGG